MRIKNSWSVRVFDYHFQSYRYMIIYCTTCFIRNTKVYWFNSGPGLQTVPQSSRPPGGRLFPIRRLPVPPEDHAQRRALELWSAEVRTLRAPLSPSVSPQMSSITFSHQTTLWSVACALYAAAATPPFVSFADFWAPRFEKGNRRLRRRWCRGGLILPYPSHPVYRMNLVLGSSASSATRFESNYRVCRLCTPRVGLHWRQRSFE